MRRGLVIVAVVIAALGVGLTLGHGSSSTRAASVSVPVSATSAACETANAGVTDDYSAGTSVAGHDLVAVLEQCETADPREVKLGLPGNGIEAKTYVYGECDPPASSAPSDPGEPAPEGGCAPPVEVQVFDACRRNVAMYDQYPGQGAPAREDTTLRGVPAAVFEDGTHIELYTGRSTVVIWGQNAALAKQAVPQLQGTGAREGIGKDEDLPAPSAGAMAGKLAC